MRLAVLAFVYAFCLIHATAQETSRRQVTIHVTEGEPIKGLFVRADETSITVQSGVAESTIKLDKVASIVFEKDGAVASPAPTPKVDKQPAQDAIKALRRLASATEVGVNYTDYGRVLIEVKAEVDGALPRIQNAELRSDINSAMVEYAYASELWTYFLRTKGIPTKSDMGRALIERYNIPIKISFFTTLTRDVALPYVWRSAREYYEKAKRRADEVN